MLNNLSMREKILLGLTFFLLIGGSYYMWIFIPIQEDIEGLHRDIQDMEMRLMQARITAQRLPQLEAELEEIEGQLDRLVELIPPREQVGEFLYDLELLSREMDLRLKTFRPQRTEIVDDQYGEVHFRFNASGEFTNIILFKTALEEFPRILDIRDLSLSGAEGEGPGWVELNITVVTYFLL